jgi:hypothetical protein
MRNRHFSVRFAFSFAFLLSCCFAAQAQTRTFVSGLGSDANPCTRISPCRSFQRAHDVVVPGGEVIALDSAGYGPITITKSVSIIGDGGYAGINTSSGNGVTINTPGITVILHSLTIEGLGSGTDGIHAGGFTALHIDNCIVNRFTNHGISVGGGTVFIKDSISRNNGALGIFFGSGIGTIERTRLENNNIGITVTGATVTARGCLSSGNSVGFLAQLSGELNIENSVASNNALGIYNFIGTVRVSNSTVTNNTSFGFANGSSGTFESRGNNTVAGNNGGGAQTTGTITPISGQ